MTDSGANTGQKELRVLLVEPYFGGSHRVFLQGLRNALGHDFVELTLPPRKWKMRMQLAAPWMAARTLELIEATGSFDCALCSSLLDAATYRSLLCKAGVRLPLGVYFHENQFAYPNQVPDPQTYQFSALNFTSALAADALAFNSGYNLNTFLTGVEHYLGKAVDMDVTDRLGELRRKSTILYPGMEYSSMDPAPGRPGKESPVIVWNHRWEHDKDPDTFFQALYELSDAGVDFRLIVLGRSFARRPRVFAEAARRLRDHIIHFGYVEDRTAYLSLLKRGTLVVSTALHEFFGMAVLEAVRCGCRPLVPDGLAYREIFPGSCRYSAGTLVKALGQVLGAHDPLSLEEIFGLTEPYGWPRMARAYVDWFADLSDTATV